MRSGVPIGQKRVAGHQTIRTLAILDCIVFGVTMLSHLTTHLDGSLPIADTLLSARAVWLFDSHCTFVLIQLEDNAPLRVDQIRVRRAVRSGLALGSESDLSGASLSRTILTKY